MTIKNNKQFNVSLNELRYLMEYRGQEALEKINADYGGIAGLCVKLQTDPNNGLPNDNEELEARQICFGKNEIPPNPSKSFLKLVFEASKDVTLLILMGAAALLLIISYSNDTDSKSNLIESAAILIAVVVVVLITSLNDWSKEKQFRNLQSKIETEHKFSVIRNGNPMDVIINELVVGDIAIIKYGDLLPADGILIRSNDLKIDESSLTGESDYVKKHPELDPILLSGTHAMEGSGRMLITAVGINSQTGIIMTLLGAAKNSNSTFSTQNAQNSETHKNQLENNYKQQNQSKKTTELSFTNNHAQVEITPTDLDENIKSKSVLQEKLTNLATKIGYIGATVSIAVIIILLLNYFIKTFPKNTTKDKNVLLSILNFIITGVTVLVIAVPEGLPLAITLALTYSVKKMMKDNNLVRHLNACETMGNATSICSDKTGTLTTNQMTVVESYINDHLYQKTLPNWSDLDEKTRNLLINGIAINSGYTSRIIQSPIPGGQRKQVGNKTECALLGFVTDLGQSYEKIREFNPEESLVKVYTFNSIRKSMMTVIKRQNGGYRVFAKGASEVILLRCNYSIKANGIIAKFDNAKLSEMVKNVIEPMASNALRTIGLAYKDFVIGRPEENEYLIENDINWEDESFIQQGMTLIAIVGIQDPVRPEVPEAIAKCKEAGITVRMVTGDNVNTARSIATACGILNPKEDFLVLESKEFNKRIRNENGQVSQQKLDQIWPKLRVLARAQPSDKYVLVKGIIDSKCTKNREVVAVTGDGTNDAPALKKADVGFAMGITGTDVAKEASDIILTDDNFTSIVKAVMWGRNVYDSIAKFLQFQMTVNVVAVAIALVGAFCEEHPPIKAVQMLWVNLIMDTLASLALATEMPTMKLLKRKPYGRTKSLISRTMVKNIFGHALYELTILLLILFFGKNFFNEPNENENENENKNEETTHPTFIFNAFVLMTLFNEINSRKIHGERNVFQGLFSNWIFCVIWVSTFILQWIIVQMGGKWFSTKPLDPRHWLICLLLGILELLWGQILATIPSNIIPKYFSFGKGEVQPTSILVTGEYDMPEIQQTAGKESGLLPHTSARPGQILWLLGLTRLQTQMRVIRAFQSTASSSHPALLKSSAENRLRQSYRRLRIAKEREMERANQSGNRSLQFQTTKEKITS